MIAKFNENGKRVCVNIQSIHDILYVTDCADIYSNKNVYQYTFYVKGGSYILRYVPKCKLSYFSRVINFFKKRLINV